MNRFYEILFIALAMLLLTVVLSSCSMPFGRRIKVDPIITEPPTPVIQLWQAAKKSNWLVTLSILGVAGGVFATLNGASKLGIAVIASSSVSLFMSLAVARFAMWMAVFGLMGSIATALFSILVRRKALMEIITGVQTMKNISVDPANAKTILSNTQSATTKKIVGSMKNELKLAGTI